MTPATARPVRSLKFRTARLFALSTCLLSASHQASAEEHTVLCGCCMFNATNSSTSSANEDGFATFRVVDRWINTASGSAGGIGDAVTLTYGIVPDGTAIAGFNGEPSAPSNLVSFLNTNIGPSTTWLPLFHDAYGRWSEIAGITMIYEANDDGVALASGGSNGVLGTRADMRIGGHYIDGQSGSNTLAYNFYPDTGDQVIDTSNVDFYSNAGSNYIRLRNVLMHEAGHGIGIAHFISDNSNGLMEPSINTSFDGPQHDDILAAQRNYGDALEKNGGNDTIAKATSLGTINGQTQTLSVGTHAKDNTALVLASESDYISIDGTSDTDVFAFSLGGQIAYDISILMDPKGPTYNEGAQGGTQTALNTKALSNLELELLDSLGGVLFSVDAFGAGLSEVINTVLAPGDYFARISTGSVAVDNIQMYRLDISAVQIPEPSALFALAFGGLILIRRRRAA